MTALKGDVETLLIEFAKKKLGFDFSFVLYDVTTLYMKMVSLSTRYHNLWQIEKSFRMSKSVRVIIEAVKKVTDAGVIHAATKEEALWRSPIPEETRLILKDLGITY